MMEFVIRATATQKTAKLSAKERSFSGLHDWSLARTTLCTKNHLPMAF